MNDIKNIETLIAFIDKEITYNNKMLRSITYNTSADLADKSFYFGKMDAYMDLRDKMTKLQINISQPQLFEFNEHQLTSTSTEDQF
jgi:hypothetical protein